MHYGCDETYKYTLQPDWSREKRELQVHYLAGTQPSHALPILRSQECESILHLVLDAVRDAARGGGDVEPVADGNVQLDHETALFLCDTDALGRVVHAAHGAADTVGQITGGHCGHAAESPEVLVLTPRTIAPTEGLEGDEVLTFLCFVYILKCLCN